MMDAGSYEPDLFRQLSAVEEFTVHAAQLQYDTSLSSHEKAEALVAHYQQAVSRLQATGDLTPAVDREFRALAEDALSGLSGLSQEMGQSLLTLLATYDPEAKRREEELQDFRDRQHYWKVMSQWGESKPITMPEGPPTRKEKFLMWRERHFGEIRPAWAK